jgi:hypothetical protein
MTTANIKVKLEPFLVPSSAREARQIRIPGVAQPSSAFAPVAPVDPSAFQQLNIQPRDFNLSELDGETLDEMCNEFRREVFKRAGKPDNDCGAKQVSAE